VGRVCSRGLSPHESLQAVPQPSPDELPARAGRLADLRADDPGVYATDIRAHLTKHGGLPSRSYRALYDPWGPKDRQQRTWSLWSTSAEKAARELRNAARKQPGRSRVTPVSGRATTISLKS